MSIINGLNEPDTRHRFKKKHKMAFLSHNNLQDELTIEESIFASDNETLKVIFIYKTMETKKGCVCYTKTLEL
jgi:ATP-binding cassette subfamily F protein uup